MTLAGFHERVCEPPLAQVRKKGALPLCCCVLTHFDTSGESFCGSESDSVAVDQL